MLAGDRAAGEDLVQEALIRCLPAWGRLDPPGVEAYVRKVMARLAWGARRRHRPDLHSSLDQANPVTRDIAEASVELADLQRALANLPSQQRVVLVLRYWQDLSEAEVAELLGCRQGTVKSRASRAYAQLRQEVRLTDDEATVDNSPIARRDVP